MRLYLLQLGIVATTGTPFPGYLIQTADGINVLIDTGCPRSIIDNYEQIAKQFLESAPDDELTAFNARVIRGIRFEPEDLVVDRLAAIGVTPQDIDYLVCTHFDWDHAGNHDRFPNAEFVVQRRHYDLALGHARFRLFGAPWDRPTLRYRFVEGDTALLPGIDLIETNGHVPGHQSVLVRLPEAGTILLASDAIANHDQFRQQVPDSIVDMDHGAKRAGIERLVNIGEREKVTLTIFGHDAEQWRVLRKSPEYYT